MCFSPFLHWVPPFTLLTPGNFLWTFFCHCRSSTFFYYSSYQSVLWLIINSLNIGQKSAKTWGWIADFIFIHDAIVVPVVGKRSEYSTDYNVYSIPVFLLSPLSPFAYVRAKSLQLCPTLWDLLDYPARLLCPWDSPGKNTGVGCCALLQGIFLSQGLKLNLLCLQHWQVDSFPPVATLMLIPYWKSFSAF